MMVALVIFGMAIMEAFFVAGYRHSIDTGAQTLMRVTVDQFYTEIHDLWHEITLISSAVSRSDAVREFVRTGLLDGQTAKNLRATVSLTSQTNDKVTALIITDFQDTTLFANSAQDLAVIDHARSMMGQGLVVKSPVHLQMGHGEDAVTYCINCTDPKADGEPMYTILVYPLAQLRQRFAALADADMAVMLLDGGDEVVMANRPQTQEGVAAFAAMARNDARERRQFMQVRRLSWLRWQLIATLDYEMEALRLQPIHRFALWTNVIMVAGLAVLFLVLRRQIYTPVRRMVRFMRRVAGGDAHQRLDLAMNNELSAIQDGMNDMLDRMEKMAEDNQRSQQRAYALNMERKQAEIAALTSHINPHFLFNTLDAMRGITMAGDSAEVEEAITALASIFRHATRASADVPLAGELSAIGQYMTIVHIRHGGQIAWEASVTEEASACLIPKMLLQPIVENAVMHGLETVSRKGTLWIDARVTDGMLIICIENNGRGITPDELERLTKSLEREEEGVGREGYHIGLVNIHRRLRLQYGSPCGLTLEAREDGGVRVTVRVRAQRF